MKTEIINRKGARKAQDIPDQALNLLNKGEIETVNLTEWLAIDQVELVKNTFPKIGLSEVIPIVKSSLAELKNPSTMNSIKAIGETLYQHCSENNNIEQIFISLSKHKSDTIRCYAPYLVALNENLSIEEKLNKSLKSIADKHFGVREVVWMALRPEIDANLTTSINILSGWTSSEDENVRRFTTEATRPRGVWCKHIERLKEKPEQALPILEPLKSDKSKYVQDSVGNWLNDASKSKSEFVESLCNKWEKESPTKETKNIVKRARRTIDKK